MGHPTVEVTLLFTDIEGSTALAHELGDGYVDLLAQHNRIVRDAIGHHVGVEARNEGDSFFAVFDRAADAVQAALDAQRALAAQQWAHGRPVRVRMGLHTGPAIRLLHDFAGLNVHLASRVAGATHGGQVVASQAVLDALAPDAGFEWLELGAHIVKDFPQPIELYQLVADGLATKFPPLVTIDARDHNLPAMVTSFVGRTDELADLRTLLSGAARLVSITGPGGVGKTRLATEAAWSVLGRYRGGGWFVDFAPVTDPALIVDTIADALDVRARGGAARLDLVVEKLSAGKALLVLDNLEHLLSGVVVVAELLKACPTLVVLATTRERLRLQGEHEVALDGLDHADAVDLFAARAALVRRDPAVGDEVAVLCDRVGGLPLAIELAAARLRTESVAALVAGMDHMLDTLTEGERDRPARHQAMRAAIALSVDSLTEAERGVFRSFAVFAGGATAEAVAAVCAPKADELQSLVDKSLLRARNDRFAMLEPIRQFADERLGADVPAEREQRVQAHADFFVSLAQRLEPALVTAGQHDALDALAADHANLRLAWERGAGDKPLRLASALTRFWATRGSPHEGRGVLTRVLESHPDAEPTTRAKALVGLGHLAIAQDDLAAARPHLSEAIELGDAASAAAAHGLLAEADRFSGQLDSADQHCRDALLLAESIGDDRLVAIARLQQGTVAYARGDHDTAVQMWRAAVSLSEVVGDTTTAIRAVGNLGVVLRLLGDAAGAVEACERSLELARVNADRGAEARAMLNLAITLATQLPGDADAAALARPAGWFHEAIAIFEELGFRRELASALISTPVFVDNAAEALRAVARARGIFVQMGDDAGVAQADAQREMLLAATATPAPPSQASPETPDP